MEPRRCDSLRQCLDFRDQAGSRRRRHTCFRNHGEREPSGTCPLRLTALYFHSVCPHLLSQPANALCHSGGSTSWSGCSLQTGQKGRPSDRHPMSDTPTPRPIIRIERSGKPSSDDVLRVSRPPTASNPMVAHQLKEWATVRIVKRLRVEEMCDGQFLAATPLNQCTVANPSHP